MNILERKVLERIGEDPNSPDVFLDTDEGIAPIRDSSVIDRNVQASISFTSKNRTGVLPIQITERVPWLGD